VFTIDEATGGLELSHTMVLSSKDFPGDPGPVKCMRFVQIFITFLATNSHWARMVGYGPLSLCIIHKEGLCLSSGDINRLMRIIIIIFDTHNNYPAQIKCL
jgi:hypothetical protein